MSGPSRSNAAGTLNHSELLFGNDFCEGQTLQHGQAHDATAGRLPEPTQNRKGPQRGRQQVWRGIAPFCGSEQRNVREVKRLSESSAVVVRLKCDLNRKS
jgi:hypothetical protein